MMIFNRQNQGWRWGIFWLFAVASSAFPAVELYVAPTGDDTASGALSEPFATVQQAQKAVRKLKQKASVDEIIVYIRGGRYELSEPIVFRAADSGTEACPITYQAFPGEEPVFSGARQIFGWQKLKKPIPGISAAASGQLWTAKVPKGRSFSYLYINGNAHYRSVNPDTDMWEEWPQAGCANEVLSLPEDLQFHLPNSSDVEINYLPTPYTKWINLFNTVTEINDGAIRLKKPVLKIGILEPTSQIPVRVENTVEGIDRPGEWCVNSKTGTVYLWPPQSDSVDFAKDVSAAQLDTLFILEGKPVAGLRIAHLTFEGLVFEAAKTGISMRSAQNCVIRACRIESMDDTGLSALNIQNVCIEHCLIAYCGRNGIAVGTAVDGKELELSAVNSENCIEHNEVHHCGQIHWQSRAITLSMARNNLIRYNYIHDVPYAGIFIGGRRFYLLKSDLNKAGKNTQDGIPESDMTIYGLKKYVPGHNRVENNVVHDAMIRLHDGGAIYCHASHHNLLKNNIVYRLHGSFGVGLYFDDDEIFSTMENNLVFAREGDPAPRFGIHTHDNACNYILRNIVAFANKPISSPRSYGGHVLVQNVLLLREGGVNQGDLSRNSGRYKDLKWDAGQPIMDNNLYWSTDGGALAAEYLDVRQKAGFDLNAVIEDPGFENVLAGKFAFSTASPVWQMGIQPIDTSMVGIQSGSEAVKGKSACCPKFF